MTLKTLDEMSHHFTKVAEASSDDFGHSVTACMEWQCSQIWKLDENGQKLISALRRAVESLESVGSVHANRPRHAEEKYWTDMGCLQRFAETLATDTRMAREALADIKKILEEK